MHRIFGRQKPQGPPEPKPDLGAHVQKMQGRVPEIDKKIQDIDVQLLGIKKQLAVARTPSQKNQLKQQAMQLLKRKKMYEGQRGQIQQTTFNLDMVQCKSHSESRQKMLPIMPLCRISTERHIWYLSISLFDFPTCHWTISPTNFHL